MKIKGGGQEMAAMLLMKNNSCSYASLKFITINNIVAISWLPPLISQHFSPKFINIYPFTAVDAIRCIYSINAPSVNI